MAYGVWGGEVEDRRRKTDRELEYRESEDDEVGRIFYYGPGGGAAGAGGRRPNFLAGTALGKNSPEFRIYSNNFLLGSAQTTLSCPPLHPR